MSLKVYLAGPFQWKDIISDRAAELRADGIVVTSRWLEEPHKPHTQLSDVTEEQKRFYANQDVEDIEAADLLVFWDNVSFVRVGRHVEFGIAIAEGRRRPQGFPIFVVGPPANVFHSLAQVHHFPSWEAVRQRLLDLTKLTLIEA